MVRYRGVIVDVDEDVDDGDVLYCTLPVQYEDGDEEDLDTVECRIAVQLLYMRRYEDTLRQYRVVANEKKELEKKFAVVLKRSSKLDQTLAQHTVKSESVRTHKNQALLDVTRELKHTQVRLHQLRTR